MKYNAVGKCIYCGVTNYSLEPKLSTKPLGLEHIIPKNIGGALELPFASCHDCEAITSGFEDKCLKGWFFARPHLGLGGRKSGKVRKDLSVGITNLLNIGTLMSVPLDQHPGYVLNGNFPVAGIFSGLPDNPDIKVSIEGTPVVPNAMVKMRRLASEGQRIFLGGRNGNSPTDYARLLAKIAHSFTIANLGIDGFTAILRPIILGNDRYPWRYVGSGMSFEQAGTELHEVSLQQRRSYMGEIVITCRIRLFASFWGTPTHYVAVGFPLKPPNS